MSFPDIADTFQPRLPGAGPFIPQSSAGGAAMRNAKFVDPNTDVPLAQQTGSDEAPFATIAQAIAALGLVGGGAVLLNPGQYPAEALVLATQVPLTFRGLSYADAAPCDLSLVTLASRETVALVDVFNFGSLTYRFNLYLENSKVTGDAIHSVEGEGNCKLINSEVTGQLETDQGEARQSAIGLFFNNTGSCFLTDSNVVTQLTASGNLIASGVVGQNFIPSGTTIDLTVTAVGYTLDNFTCFRLQQVESCQISGTLTVVDTELHQPIRNCSFVAGAVLSGPAGASFQLDNVSYASFLAAGGTVAGGATLEVLASQPHATISIVVPALAAGELGYATGSLVGTILEGIQPNTPICVTATQDLTAAGATRGGVYGSPRISAANTVKVAFNGALAGGASNFIVTQL